MPIVKGLGEQRAGRQLGRIRIGQQVTGRNGKLRPDKLDTFRFTAASQYAIERIAAVYGGEARRWEGAPTAGQWEVTTDSAELRVAIPPGSAALSQWYELWTGGGAVRRCDGETEQLTREPCMCPFEPADRAALAQRGEACKPTTRVNVILPDVPDVGVWRLDSHGFNAAVELGATVELLAAASAQHVIIPAVLRLEQRQSKSLASGKAETRNYAVPVLEIRQTLHQLVAAGGGSTMALPAPMGEPLLAIAGAPTRARDARPDVTSPEGWALAVQGAATMAELDELGKVARVHKWDPDTYVEVDGSDALEKLGDLFKRRTADLQRDAS